MPVELDPNNTSRAKAFALWMKATDPMVTVFKTLNVTKLVRMSRKYNLKINMLIEYCIGKAAVDIPEFYSLPVDGKLLRYNALALSTIVKNKEGEVNSCDVLFTEDLKQFNRAYLKTIRTAAESCSDLDLSDKCMVIGTSAMTVTELDGVVGMNTGFYNNPFLYWGKIRKHFFKSLLPVSFMFHHAQMDGDHAGRFLHNLQEEINRLR